jgi:L-asparaginase
MLRRLIESTACYRTLPKNQLDFLFSHSVLTHGTDTMPDIADALVGLPDKTIVLTGALTPARFRTTDAVFNVGMAVAAAQVARPGVYIAMSGQVFAAGEVRKNRDENRFEAL